MLTGLLIAGCATLAKPAPPPPGADLVNDVAAARDALVWYRYQVAADEELPHAERASELVRLGAWEEVERLLRSRSSDRGLRIAEAELRFRQHRFDEAERLIQNVLALDASHVGARHLLARLHMQAWRFEAARGILQTLLRENPRSEEATLLLGQIDLFEKDYAGALDRALVVQRWNPRNAHAHRLEADVRFWDQNPAAAEAPLVRALELDPFDPDARFNYGYAIWRRVDATLLDEMAAHWNLGLEVHPLHYVTHWHWGNGHTNLTYADYVEPSDEEVRGLLALADSLISAGDIQRAVQVAQRVGRSFPRSPLPPMLRGSAHYMDHDTDLHVRADAAEAAFVEALRRKPNYGPAHNGLAAVIKQRQFAYLDVYDSLSAEIAREPLPVDPHFESIFYDIDYFPGTRVRQMVRAQLGPGIALLPLIDRFGGDYSIPPLHKDLAEALDAPHFRVRTTFDNRQWMDIRGVGSGAAGIEYVERGAHLERNVVAHEFAHQFHGRILTDQENRRIRELYFAAMEGGHTLDYYASNNEAEYFAQVYEAFIMPAKVHPLNHKSLNTAQDLRRLDPAAYAFMDSLAMRADRYTAGDTAVYASNWAEMYRRLALQALEDDDEEFETDERRWREAEAMVDSALIWDPFYIPAVLTYAEVEADQKRFESGAAALSRAEMMDPEYAPTFRAWADLAAARAEAGEISPEEAFAERTRFLAVALEREDDLVQRANLQASLRGLFVSYARVPEAIELGERYLANAPTISTGLRQHRDRAASVVLTLKGMAGYTDAAIEGLSHLVAQHPQNANFRQRYADVLALAGRHEEAIHTLTELQRVFRSAGTPRAEITIQKAEIRLDQGDRNGAQSLIAPMIAGAEEPPEESYRYVRVLADLGHIQEAREALAEIDPLPEPQPAAERAYSLARLANAEGRHEEALDLFRSAIVLNPYHAAARIHLVAALRAHGEGEVDPVIRQGGELELPIGPALQSRLSAGQP